LRRWQLRALRAASGILRRLAGRLVNVSDAGIMTATMATMIDFGELYGALPSLRARRIYPRCGVL
jgi:hypothetical protein